MDCSKWKDFSSEIPIAGSVPRSDGLESFPAQEGDGIVSFQSELPVSLQSAMTKFIEGHPHWDQYRLVQAALAGFLVQNGVDSRSITRLYLGNMFKSDSFMIEN